MERTEFADCEGLRLEPCDAGSTHTQRTLLVPFDRPRRIQRPSTVAVLRPARWLHALRELASEDRPAGALQAAAPSTIDLLPYQLEPALAIIRHGIPRVMVADVVGLGKTIQAGLVLAELARSEGFRGLVVAPAGLREQWSLELRCRFNLEAKAADAEWLDHAGRDLPADVNPWALPGLYLSSFDFIKRPEVLEPLEHVHWDIVVVDEAHGASLGSARRAAVQAVASRSRRVLLLTATPHAGDVDQFAALCRIGEVGSNSPPLLMFQRSRGEIGTAHIRRTMVLPVRPTEAERRMHRLLDDYSSRVCREAAARRDVQARLAAIVLKKRALSSAGSLAASARRRLAMLRDEQPAAVEYQAALPLGGEGQDEGIGDAPPDAVLAVPGLEDAGAERRWLSAIVAAAENAAGAESKRRVVLRFLTRIREPVVVFTEFRDTLDDLYVAAIRAGHDVQRLHGGLSAAERLSSISDFLRRGGLLLATDAAAEGLNLQHGIGRPGCRAVMHYELPWSPARLEQRTGRVDRIGQQRRVHQILLVADDTAERLVLAPMARRAARAGGAAPSLAHLARVLGESRVAAAVMEGRPLDGPETSGVEPPPPLPVVAPLPSLRQEAEAEALRIGRERACRETFRSRRRSCGVFATVVRLQRAAISPGLVCVYLVSLASPTGVVKYRHVICAHVGPHRIPDESSAAGVRHAVRTWIEQCEPAVRAAMSQAETGPLAGAAAQHARALDELLRRDAGIRAALPSAARELVQVGLFDRRALKSTETRRRSVGELLEATEERLAATARGSALVTSIELKAVLVLRRSSS